MDAPSVSAATLRQSLASARPPLVIDVRKPPTFLDDHEMLGHGMVMYDARYRWCKEGEQEAYRWNPEAYK